MCAFKKFVIIQFYFSIGKWDWTTHKVKRIALPFLLRCPFWICFAFKPKYQEPKKNNNNNGEKIVTQKKK